MAAVTQLDRVATTTAGNKSTTSVAVTLGGFILIIAHNSGRTTAQVGTLSDDNPVSSTYTQITSATKNTSADSQWVFVRNKPIENTTNTIFTWTQSGDTGGGLVVFQITGMTMFGPGAIRQTGKQDNAGTGTPSITMGKAFLTGNAGIGQVHTGQTGTTNTAPPTSWTETGDAGYSTPSTGIESVTRNSGETNTTIAWTAATTSAFSSVLIELDTTFVPHRNPYVPLLPQ
jgi:hypothetical protein